MGLADQQRERIEPLAHRNNFVISARNDLEFLAVMPLNRDEANAPSLTRPGFSSTWKLSGYQWRSGIAAWLGWLFDGLELHLYTLVAAPFVAQLLHVSDPASAVVKEKGSFIQGAFLVGWALGGAFFGVLGDRLGRSRTLSLTILTYAIFTGLSFFVETWWQLLICRFIAALGIGGEWAVGASLLFETWPKKWRPWIAGVLQTGVNLGILMACVIVYLLAGRPERYVFLVGILPALLVFWIRKNVPEPAEWQAAQTLSPSRVNAGHLFHEGVRSRTFITITVCSLTLTGWWAFLFWYPQHLRSLPEVLNWSPAEKQRLITKMFFTVIAVSIVGNFFCSWLASRLGYRKTLLWMCLAFFLGFVGAYSIPRNYHSLFFWLPFIGFCSGMFGLFTMYLPSLFPTLLRTTGAGFCYNIGRIAAAAGTIFFGMGKVISFQHTLMSMGFLFFAAAIVCLFLPEPLDEATE